MRNHRSPGRVRLWARNGWIGTALLSVALLPATPTSAAEPSAYEVGVAAFEVGEFAAAYAAWLPLAHGGDADAQRNIALLLQTGRGVSQDRGAAFYWYRLAAEAGDAAAANSIAMMYLAGEGLASDYVAAQAWLLRAAESGFAPALYNLGLLYERGLGVDLNDRTALGWYVLAAEAGQPGGIDRVVATRNRLQRLGSTPGDSPQSRLSAELSWAIVRGLTAGEQPIRANFPPETPPEAVRPGLLGALEPPAPALLVAEAADSRRGLNRIALADRARAGVAAISRSDWATALNALYGPAIGGDAEAQYLIGTLYAEGRGVEPDSAAAVAWWAQAATQGHAGAAAEVERLGAQLDPDQLDRAIRLWAARTTHDPAAGTAETTLRP
jgi:TPR repeat protein